MTKRCSDQWKCIDSLEALSSRNEEDRTGGTEEKVYSHNQRRLLNIKASAILGLVTTTWINLLPTKA